MRRIGALRVLLGAKADASQQDFTVLTPKDQLFADWLDETGAMAALVRPDRYVYGVARTAPELERLIDDLFNALFNH